MIKAETQLTNIMDSISKTPLTLLQRLNSAEEVALATSTIPEIAVVRLRFSCAERIVSTDARLVLAKQLLVQHGILTQERADEVFNFTT